MKKLFQGEIKLAKKWFVLLIFVSVVFLALTITFALISGKRYRDWQAANEGYQQLYSQCQDYDTAVIDLNKQVEDLNYQLKVKDIYIEVANKETEEQKAYVKEYQDYLNDLKVQLALRGIETGDFTALNEISEDFAKQYQSLKEEEAKLAEDYENEMNGENNTSDSEEESDPSNPWNSLTDALKGN